MNVTAGGGQRFIVYVRETGFGDRLSERAGHDTQ